MTRTRRGIAWFGSGHREAGPDERFRPPRVNPVVGAGVTKLASIRGRPEHDHRPGSPFSPAYPPIRSLRPRPRSSSSPGRMSSPGAAGTVDCAGTVRELPSYMHFQEIPARAIGRPNRLRSRRLRWIAVNGLLPPLSFFPTQNPVRLTPREGSTPSSGTNAATTAPARCITASPPRWRRCGKGA